MFISIRRGALLMSLLVAGPIAAGAAQEATNALAAERGARALALEHAGAVAFSRTGDPSIGDFQDALILAQFGEVDLDALSA